MISQADLERELHTLLACDDFRDGCPNGLQVEGGAEIQRIATACTASLAAIHQACEHQADALLVHHGLLWGKSFHPVRGLYRNRLAPLLAANCSLFAYHLPLDAHPEHGNNAALLRLLGAQAWQPFGAYHGQTIGLYADMPAMTIDQLHSKLAGVVNHAVVHCPGAGTTVTRIGVVTGGGQSLLLDAAAAGCQVLVTGETSEQTWHEALESGCHCLAAGHHATEDIAIHQLGTWLAQRHDLHHQAIHLDNPL